MKKLILTVAILASGVSTFAMPNTIMNNETIVVVMNDEFKEVGVDQLPAAVTTAVKKDFAAAAITKAAVNGSEQYKLTLSIDGSESVVYANKDGKWLKKEDITSSKTIQDKPMKESSSKTIQE